MSQLKQQVKTVDEKLIYEPPFPEKEEDAKALSLGFNILDGTIEKGDRVVVLEFLAKNTSELDAHIISSATIKSGTVLNLSEFSWKNKTIYIYRVKIDNSLIIGNVSYKRIISLSKYQK